MCSLKQLEELYLSFKLSIFNEKDVKFAMEAEEKIDKGDSKDKKEIKNYYEKNIANFCKNNNKICLSKLTKKEDKNSFTKKFPPTTTKNSSSNTTRRKEPSLLQILEEIYLSFKLKIYTLDDLKLIIEIDNSQRLRYDSKALSYFNTYIIAYCQRNLNKLLEKFNKFEDKKKFAELLTSDKANFSVLISSKIDEIKDEDFNKAFELLDRFIDKKDLPAESEINQFIDKFFVSKYEKNKSKFKSILKGVLDIYDSEKKKNLTNKIIAAFEKIDDNNKKNRGNRRSDETRLISELNKLRYESCEKLIDEFCEMKKYKFDVVSTDEKNKDGPEKHDQFDGYFYGKCTIFDLLIFLTIKYNNRDVFESEVKIYKNLGNNGKEYSQTPINGSNYDDLLGNYTNAEGNFYIKIKFTNYIPKDNYATIIENFFKEDKIKKDSLPDRIINQIGDEGEYENYLNYIFKNKESITKKEFQEAVENTDFPFHNLFFRLFIDSNNKKREKMESSFVSFRKLFYEQGYTKHQNNDKNKKILSKKIPRKYSDFYLYCLKLFQDNYSKVASFKNLIEIYEIEKLNELIKEVPYIFKPNKKDFGEYNLFSKVLELIIKDDIKSIIPKLKWKENEPEILFLMKYLEKQGNPSQYCENFAELIGGEGFDYTKFDMIIGMLDYIATLGEGSTKIFNDNKNICNIFLDQLSTYSDKIEIESNTAAKILFFVAHHFKPEFIDKYYKEKNFNFLTKLDSLTIENNFYRLALDYFLFQREKYFLTERKEKYQKCFSNNNNIDLKEGIIFLFYLYLLHVDAKNESVSSNDKKKNESVSSNDIKKNDLYKKIKDEKKIDDIIRKMFDRKKDIRIGGMFNSKKATTENIEGIVAYINNYLGEQIFSKNSDEKIFITNDDKNKSQNYELKGIIEKGSLTLSICGSKKQTLELVSKKNYENDKKDYVYLKKEKKYYADISYWEVPSNLETITEKNYKEKIIKKFNSVPNHIFGSDENLYL